jgi:hypothetical protein
VTPANALARPPRTPGESTVRPGGSVITGTVGCPPPPKLPAIAVLAWYPGWSGSVTSFDIRLVTVPTNMMPRTNTSAQVSTTSSL